MRIDRNRRYRTRPIHVGPPTVTRQILPEDTYVAFFWRTGREMEYNATFNQPDPFGFTDYNVPYSLNKQKRWRIPERLKEEIEDLQDPYHNLRVSVSIHEFDRADINGIKRRDWEQSTPCRSYHTVASDGCKVVNNYAKKGDATIHNLIDPWKRRKPIHNLFAPVKYRKPWDSRKDEWKMKNEYEEWDRRPNSYLLEDENVVDQKLHVLYSTAELVSKATAHNGLPRERREQDKKMKKKKITRKHSAWMLDQFVESDQEEENDEEEESNPVLEKLVVPSLASFLPAMKDARPRQKKGKRKPFSDETLSCSTQFSFTRETPAESSTDDAEEKAEAPADVVISESHTKIILVSALPQLYTKMRLVDTVLQSMPSLPVFPRAWTVHRESTAQVLGRAFPICIVAKEFTEGEIAMFAHENCLRCADRRGRLRVLFEDADGSSHPARQSLISTCMICYREMEVNTVFEQARPFSLACGHACCTDCWLRMISEGMKRKRLPIDCPEPCCHLTLSITVASALLDSASLRKYTDAMVEVLLQQQKIVRCRDCSRLHRVESSRSTVRCECGTSICSRCSSNAHAPVSCGTFREYCSYTQMHADTTILRNLAKCPTCGELGEPMEERCTFLVCVCREWFCYMCGQKSTSQHCEGAGNCEAKNMHTSVTLVDVSTLHPTILTRAIDGRLLCIDLRKEVMGRLNSLSIKNRKESDRTFTRLSHLMQICYLNSIKSRRSMILAERIQFAMSYFFNTEDRNRRNLLHKTEMITKILNDISTELFEGVSVAHRKKKIQYIPRVA